jgi:Zn-dependent protease
MNPLSDSNDTQLEAPKTETAWSRVKKALGPIGVIGVVILKFLAKIKFVLPILLKTGGSMLITIGVYAMVWGWKFAVGFVLLLMLHECGHLIVAKKFGLKVSAPMFIPFVGAFILLKEAPRNAWMEACVGIGGPMFGSLAALLCHAVGIHFGTPLLIALAWSGYFLNLFNLAPVGMLDSGRIVTASRVALASWFCFAWLGLAGHIRISSSGFFFSCHCREFFHSSENVRKKSSVTLKSHRPSAGPWAGCISVSSPH